MLKSKVLKKGVLPMSRVSPTKRKMQIRQRLERGQKLARLRQKYQTAKSLMEKEAILGKVGRVAPWLSEKEFLAGIKDKLA